MHDKKEKLTINFLRLSVFSESFVTSSEITAPLHLIAKSNVGPVSYSVIKVLSQNRTALIFEPHPRTHHIHLENLPVHEKEHTDNHQAQTEVSLPLSYFK